MKKQKKMKPDVDCEYAKSASIDNALDFLKCARDLLAEDVFEQISLVARSFQKPDLHYCQVFVGAAYAMLPAEEYHKITTQMLLENNQDGETFGNPKWTQRAVKELSFKN